MSATHDPMGLFSHLASRSMEFSLKINNCGKFTDAYVNVGRFTVFTGPNNSGKSFTSKMLYSIISAIRTNPVEAYLVNLMAPIKRRIDTIRMEMWFLDNDHLRSHLGNEFENLINLMEECPYQNFDKFNSFVLEFVQHIDNVRKELKLYQKKNEDKSELYQQISKLIDALTDVKEAIGGGNLRNIVSAGIKLEINRNIVENFQIADVSKLAQDDSQPIEVEVENIGRFNFSNGNIDYELVPVDREHALGFSNLIYLESPIYWKLKLPLTEFEPNRIMDRLHGRRRIYGIPQHFYDLCEALRYELTGEIAFPAVYEKFESELGGKITISKDGDLAFQEEGRSISLTQTSTGITNIGFLAHLIDRKVLNEDSILFIDEPEAHLHPRWQILMAEGLFDLAKNGVHVVVATHSVEFLKWLEVHIKSNPSDEEFVALNQFPPDTAMEDDDFFARLSRINESLTDPFAELYIKGI